MRWTSRNIRTAPAASFNPPNRWPCARATSTTPEHLLKVLLDDPEGLASGLIDRAGGRSREALAAVEAALAKLPKVSGGGRGRSIWRPPWRVFDQAQQVAEKAGDSYVTVERLLLALALEKDSEAGRSWRVPASRRKISMRRSTPCARAAPPTRAPLRMPMRR